MSFASVWAYGARDGPVILHCISGLGSNHDLTKLLAVGIFMVHTMIRLEMSRENFGAALEILCPLAERTRVVPGCISSRIYEDVQQAHTIMIEELWSSQEALRGHLCTSDFQRILLVIEMAKGQPEIRISTISDSRGLEVIAEARSHA